ncbi:MAG TPA: MFS transporter, partial [Thermomicrobiales bacterium]|nr:MFS transporter [Thermomicrobiales bacterium]
MSHAGGVNSPNNPDDTNNLTVVRPFWLVVGALGLTSGLGALNGMSLSAFLPFISEDLGYSVPVLGQVTTITLLLGACLGLIGGPLADHYGQRRFLLLGTGAVVVTAIGTALATGFGMLLVARLGSAFSGGLLLGTPMA